MVNKGKFRLSKKVFTGSVWIKTLLTCLAFIPLQTISLISYNGIFGAQFSVQFIKVLEDTLLRNSGFFLPDRILIFEQFLYVIFIAIAEIVFIITPVLFFMGSITPVLRRLKINVLRIKPALKRTDSPRSVTAAFLKPNLKLSI